MFTRHHLFSVRPDAPLTICGALTPDLGWGHMMHPLRRSTRVFQAIIRRQGAKDAWWESYYSNWSRPETECKKKKHMTLSGKRARWCEWSLNNCAACLLTCNMTIMFTAGRIIGNSQCSTASLRDIRFHPFISHSSTFHPHSFIHSFIRSFIPSVRQCVILRQRNRDIPARENKSGTLYRFPGWTTIVRLGKMVSSLERCQTKELL